MKKSSWLIIIVIVALSVGLLVLRASSKPALTDQEQVHALVVKGETAIEQKDLKSAMSCVSKKYKDPSGTNFEQLRAQAIQAFQQEGKYDVVMENTVITVDGETASARATVTIGLVTKGAIRRLFSNDITIRLAREKSTHWVVIPVKAWAITSIEGAAFDMGE